MFTNNHLSDTFAESCLIIQPITPRLKPRSAHDSHLVALTKLLSRLNMHVSLRKISCPFYLTVSPLGQKAPDVFAAPTQRKRLLLAPQLPFDSYTNKTHKRTISLPLRLTTSTNTGWSSLTRRMKIMEMLEIWKRTI